MLYVKSHFGLFAEIWHYVFQRGISVFRSELLRALELYLCLAFFPPCTSLTAVLLSLQVTKGMFGARKKFVEFVEVVDNDFTDESMYYNQPSMFPHRSDKDVSLLALFAHFFLT